MPSQKLKLLVKGTTHKDAPTAIHFSEISQFIAQAFIAGLWQGLVLIVAVGIFLHFISRLGAAVRFAVWGFAFGFAATMPLLHLPAVRSRPHVASAIVHLGAGWGFAIAAFWAIFMLVRGTQLLMHAIHLRRIWRRTSLPPLSPRSTHFCKSGRRTVELCTSAMWIRRA